VEKKIGIIGAGSWGTTLANLLGSKGFSVTLWVYEKSLCEKMTKTRENDVYLPGFMLSDNVVPSSSLKETVEKKEVIVSVCPSHIVRKIINDIKIFLTDQTLIISASKGIEDNTLMTMSEVFESILSQTQLQKMSFLSGPSFAREVSNKLPTAVAIASHNRKAAEEAQQILATPYFRTYTSADVKGIELGGAAKNVIAIAVGISDGLGLGHNTQAALITRGLREIIRLGEKMGADPLTFSGLSGMGDLVLTCTGKLSRNRSVGVSLGKGMRLNDILSNMSMVAEGVKTTRAIYQLSLKFNVEMPIIKQTNLVLYEGKSPQNAMKELMQRGLKHEME